MTVDGKERKWVEVSSSTERAADRRLLIAAHGSNQSPAGMRSSSGHTLDDWARAGHLVIYPQSWRGGLWNDARTSSPSRAREEDVDDVAFIKALASHYRDGKPGSPMTVYGISFSNGGQMLIRVVLETSVLHAALLVGATMPAHDNMLADLDPSGPAIPMMLVHGTKDRIVPYAGGMASLYGFRPRGLMRSFDESVTFWVERAGIPGEPDVHAFGEAGPRRGGHRLTYAAAGRPTVVAYVMTDGGHMVPNRARRPLITRRGNHSIDTMTEFGNLVDSLRHV